MSDQGASNSWVTGSTGAQLRRALDANEQLARDLAVSIEHNAALSRQLVDVTDAAARNVVRLTYARTELAKTQAALAKEREQSDDLAIRLDKAIRQRDSLARRLAVRFEETERLRTQLDSIPGYRLTAKGLAALTQLETQEQP